MGSRFKYSGSSRSSGGKGARRRSLVSAPENVSRMTVNYDLSGRSLNTRPSTPVLDEYMASSRNMILRRRYDPVQFEGFDDVRLPWEYLKTRFENFDSISSMSAVCRQDLETINKHIHPYLRHVMTFKYPMVFPPNHAQKKALLIFSKFDEYFKLMEAACAEEEMSVQVARTGNEALRMLSDSNEYFDMVLIDARFPKYIDPECISMSIRRSYIHLCTPIVAIVKKSFYNTTERLHNLLSSGVNRCIVENCSLSACSCELKQIQNSLVWNQEVMSVQQVLYTALHNLEESLIITDVQFTIQYANAAATKLLNVCMEEVISAPLKALFVANISPFQHQSMTDENLEFASNMMVRRKGLDNLLMHVRIVPTACLGRTATHYVVHLNSAKEDQEPKTAPPKECNNVNISSTFPHAPGPHADHLAPISEATSRRLSLINSQPLEAPITKVISILAQIQENSSPEEAQLIDKVLNFLQKEGLYMPQMKNKPEHDPIASDLIAALLKDSAKIIPRRNSSESLLRVRPSMALSTVAQESIRIGELLDSVLQWEFDIFQFEMETEKLPLQHLGMELFRRFDVFATLNISENVCRNWLAMVESNYHSENSYHNSTHAADVMQAIGVFITQLASKELLMDRIEEASALISAAAHDIDHPGRSSAFLCNSDNPLALLYNGSSVLEPHHAATTFRLTLADDNVNIFKNLDKDAYKVVRNIIIDMIMATEMTKHFEHLTKFVSVFGSTTEVREIVHTEEESSKLMRRMLIKVADVNNPTRPTPFSIEWAHRIAEEYFKQTEEEKIKNMPIVMPMFDRATCSIPKSQIGFMDYIIHDMVYAWDSFIDMPELVAYMKVNYSTWKSFEDRGIRTLADIKSASGTFESIAPFSN